ncbi:MAG: fructosamine kinase family protein [Lachnospiraceae bacterium]|nr:fructosamine kinase family protein [Lachnospiraceae bacterium]
MKEEIFSSLQAAINHVYGEGVHPERLANVSGGDINEAHALTLSNGRKLFMKSNRKDNLAFFTAETAGLHALADTETLPTPGVLAVGTDEEKGGRAFLLLEYVERGAPSRGAWTEFARGLNAMHRVDTSSLVPGGSFGLAFDNFIGAGNQQNTPAETWIDFFRESRLEPKFRLAEPYFGPEERKLAIRLLDRLDTVLLEPEKPSLLHGDLWGGNVMPGGDGRLWLIDPAVYVGHREADLAMTELFGGFSREFYEALKEDWPLQPGYEDRRDIYNLYHLLNHLNLFGSGYLSGVLRILRTYA